MFSSIQGNLKILVLTGSDPQFYGSYRYNSIGNSDSWFCLYTCASAHQNSYFFPVVSKNDSQLQDPRLNHFWFLFLAYIYLLLYMSAHYDIFQSSSGTWNGHVIFYWLESTLGKKSFPVGKNYAFAFGFPLSNAEQQVRQRNLLRFPKAVIE